MDLALRVSGLWLRYAALQNLIPSFPWIAPPRPPPWRNPRKGRDQISPSGNLEGRGLRRRAGGRPEATGEPGGDGEGTGAGRALPEPPRRLRGEGRGGGRRHGGTRGRMHIPQGMLAIITTINISAVTVDIGYCDYHLVTNIGYCDHL